MSRGRWTLFVWSDAALSPPRMPAPAAACFRPHASVRTLAAALTAPPVLGVRLMQASALEEQLAAVKGDLSALQAQFEQEERESSSLKSKLRIDELNAHKLQNQVPGASSVTS